MSDLFRTFDLSNFILPGESTSRFSHAEVPTMVGIPFVTVYLKEEGEHRPSLRMDLDKKVFLDPIPGQNLDAAAVAIAQHITQLQEPVGVTAKVSPQALELYVGQAAERFSIIRNAEKIFWEHQRKLQHLKEVPSSQEEMLKDWLDARAFVTLRILEGEEIRFSQIDPASYQILEDTWLKRVKQFKAYYIWKREGDHDAEKNYFRASAALRQFLLVGPRASLMDFQKVKLYIEGRYLCDGAEGKLDDSKPMTNMLIARKARRIWEMKGDNDQNANWFRARRYVAMFYENIIGAVICDNREKTLDVLRAFEFSKALHNRYLIVNGFEAAVAINFLNKSLIREILQDPNSYVFSLEAVEDWPEEAQIPERLTFEKADRELVYWGVMQESDWKEVRAMLTDERHRCALDRLYQQSQISAQERRYHLNQISPFEDGIL